MSTLKAYDEVIDFIALPSIQTKSWHFTPQKPPCNAFPS